jgi:hypothetical protein
VALGHHPGDLGNSRLPGREHAHLHHLDEGQGGTTSENCSAPSNTDLSCRAVTITVAAGAHAKTDPTFYTHYSMLRSAENALGITTYLGNAATANDMRLGMRV